MGEGSLVGGGAVEGRVIVGNNYPQQLPGRVIVGQQLPQQLPSTITPNNAQGVGQERKRGLGYWVIVYI